MKMTIEDAIRYYEDKNVVLTEEEALANTIAIKTMRKYQEIRKIYMTHHYTDEEVIEKIKEVIKWG